ncbi:hypothetical protein QKU48_gp0921 [Fadolivirus algeromassiliense]|jgi:hypothetical protein|uniref:Uncharacterized protein n=1 Tax=Fadolivirus FV1/VV64 TaxID=3070911 RepID=A0A7D3QWC7_9VIRU|nr:hypothetical protein QKU48_gp0921 [Fadolivirus algeromassiliense]QKF94379.1 hypothetical protein Fadolivirus_1_921 [Fadolivirus FV1/VV64]
MILEHFEDNKDKDVNYNEDQGMFTIKGNSLLNIFGFGNTNIYEKDISISKINDLKKQADMTTLTDYDINILYNFAKKEFNFNGLLDDFKTTNIKDVFKNIKDENLMAHKLVEMAYDYDNAIKKGETPVIEKFTLDSNTIGLNKNYLLILIFFVLILITYFFLYK